MKIFAKPQGIRYSLTDISLQELAYLERALVSRRNQSLYDEFKFDGDAIEAISKMRQRWETTKDQDES